MGKLQINTDSVSGWLAIDDAARDIANAAFESAGSAIPNEPDRLVTVTIRAGLLHKALSASKFYDRQCQDTIKAREELAIRRQARKARAAKK